MTEVPNSASLSIRLSIVFDRHRIARFVVFVAVGAGEIAPPHRDDVHQNRMFGRSKSADRVPDAARKPTETACLWHFTYLNS